MFLVYFPGFWTTPIFENLFCVFMTCSVFFHHKFFSHFLQLCFWSIFRVFGLLQFLKTCSVFMTCSVFFHHKFFSRFLQLCFWSIFRVFGLLQFLKTCFLFSMPVFGFFHHKFFLHFLQLCFW